MYRSFPLIILILIHTFTLDIRYPIKVYSNIDIMSESALFSPISEVAISAWANTADHGHQTENPLMIQVAKTHMWASLTRNLTS